MGSALLKTPEKAALIISVYKNTTDLETVLNSVKQQTASGFQVIVSEDGNSSEMRDFVQNYPGMDLMHVTHEDRGWQKNKALNNAIKATAAEYLIFIDGDCVLHPNFIENHLKFAGGKRILAGKRIKLGPLYSQKLRESASVDAFSKIILPEIFKVKKDGAKFYEEGIYISPESSLQFLASLRKMSQLKGCNFSCYRSALEAINGFDEDYVLPAIGEDIDLTWRFEGLGYRLFSMRNFAVQYHLYHKENWNDQSENMRLMEGKKNAKLYFAKNGLVKNRN